MIVGNPLFVDGISPELTLFPWGDGLTVYSAKPTFGSIVRDIGFGWSIRPNIEEYTELNDRVIKWGAVRRKVSNSERGFSGGDDSISIADTDLAVWGSFYGANGSCPLWKKVTVFPYAVNSLLGTVSGVHPIFTGRIMEVDSANNQVKLKLFDDLDRISKGKFVWDYTPLKTTEAGSVYGTIVAVHGSRVIIEETPNDTLRKTILSTDKNEVPYTSNAGENWRRLGNLGVTGTDYIYPGDIVKFSGTDLTATDAGSVLETTTAYRINEGTFLVNPSSHATMGTLELNTGNIDAKPGHFVYKQDPLWFRGHPADIIRDFLTGTNTNLAFATNIIPDAYYGAATSVCPQFYVESLVKNDEEGAIIEAIKQLSKISMAVYFFDRDGKFVWMPHRPRTRNEMDFVRADYWGTMLGGTQGTGNMYNAQWGHSAESLLTDISIFYSYNHFEDEGYDRWKAHITRQNLAVSTAHYGARIHGTIESPWITDANTAIWVAESRLREHATARPVYSFDTTLFGIEQELYDLLQLTHRTGSMKQQAWALMDVQYSIDEDVLGFTLMDVSHLYFGAGYGYFMSGSGTDTVSGTSKSGWAWPVVSGSGTHGTVATCFDSSIDIRYNNGAIPEIGWDGYTEFFVIGSEIIKAISSKNTQNKNVYRGQQTTATSGLGTNLTGLGWTAWPRINRDIETLHSGTLLDVPSDDLGSNSGIDKIFGTVHNVNTATYGTVFKFF